MAPLQLSLNEGEQQPMHQCTPKLRFKAPLLRPAKASTGEDWAFVVLPKAISAQLSRRGRTSVEGRINGQPFRAMLEPDGQLSHWLKVSGALRETCGAQMGDVVVLEIAPVAREPEPELPPDFRKALAASAEARAVWDATTTLARIDWIHWIESAKQAKTRKSRVENACQMLASGKKRVCCFDPSGFYSKALAAPLASE